MFVIPPDLQSFLDWSETHHTFLIRLDKGFLVSARLHFEGTNLPEYLKKPGGFYWDIAPRRPYNYPYVEHAIVEGIEHAEKNGFRLWQITVDVRYNPKKG